MTSICSLLMELGFHVYTTMNMDCYNQEIMVITSRLAFHEQIGITISYNEDGSRVHNDHAHDNGSRDLYIPLRMKRIPS